ncbi:hypothetical protein DZA37_00025 [Kangiella sp. HD9-110m-PIT-SAG06]|nr:hypothetical protein DZA37_00025 [Kangiella sp. HD9-110m-PIT-SAG06]
MHVERFKGRFPPYLQKEYCRIESVFDLTTKYQSYMPFDVVVQGSTLSIPSRIYIEEGQLNNPVKLIRLNSLEKEILYCFYSRHHDGYVREKCLRKIILSSNKFTAPYILQLLGEYVIEIIEVIYENRESLNQKNIVEYIRENPKHYEITRERVYSYWDCYYRRAYPKYKRGIKPKGPSYQDYAGIKMVKYLNSLVSESVL